MESPITSQESNQSAPAPLDSQTNKSSNINGHSKLRRNTTNSLKVPSAAQRNRKRKKATMAKLATHKHKVGYFERHFDDRNIELFFQAYFL